MSPVVEEIFGVRADEMTGGHFMQFLCKESVEAAFSAFTAAVEEGTPVKNLRLRMKRKDGSAFWGELSGRDYISQGEAAGTIGVIRDITEKKRMEDALLESGQRMELALKGAELGTWDWYVATGDATFNDRWAEMIGYRLDEIRPHYSTWENLVHSEDMPDVMKALQSHLDGLTDYYESEHRLKHKSGESVWVLTKGRVIERDEQGRAVRVCGTHLDITGRKRVEEALSESEARHRILFESANDGIFLGTKNGYIDCNPRTLEMFGCRREDIIGRSPMDFSPPVQPDGSQSAEKIRAYDEAIMAGRAQVFEWKHRKLDGALFDAEVSLNLVKLPSGPHILAIVRDISERKRTEEALREGQEKYRLLADNITDNIWIFDLDAFCFSYVSPSVVNITGYTAEEATGFQLSDVLTPASLELATKKLEQELANDGISDPSRSRTLELEQFYKDGSTVWTEVSMSLIRDQEGRPKAILGVTRDISERKKLQTQLQQAQKMETVGTLAGGIAHDFNNILQAVLGYSELARQKIAVGQNITRELDVVIQAGTRATDLVKHILSFSRQNEPGSKPLDIGMIVKESLNLLRASLPTTIEIKQKIAEAPETVLADPTQMHQVVMNLCTNAAQAMSETGGVLEVILEAVAIDEVSAARYAELNPGRYQRLSVSDTGHGMDKETQSRVFDPFFTTKETGMGTGLGMSVVHGIVKNHGGAITVDSQPGKGTTFHVYMPALDSHTQLEPVSAEPMLLATGTEHILFVDDEEPLVELGYQMLESLGYKVTTRTSSLEALELFKHDPDRFDLIITDQTMPKLTGVNLAREVMKIRPDIPVILCTGFSATITPEKARTAGIREFVMKPLLIRQISKTIRKVLDGEYYQDQPSPRSAAALSKAADARSETVAPIIMGSLKILLADDDHLSRILAVALLERAGHKVVAVENGQEVLAVFNRESFDLVILDQEMPGMGGIQATGVIRAKENKIGGHIPIIAMTGHGTEKVKKIFQAAGADGFISKPISSFNLLKVIEDVVGHNNE